MNIKRLFDFWLALFALILIGWLIVIFMIVQAIDTRSSGIFAQQRVGRYGKLFRIYKLRTIRESGKISPCGKFLRKSKMDELPQLINILIGDMSFVGPRPDIVGYYDRLTGENAKILELRPGLTSEASIKYRNEEKILGVQSKPLEYNDQVIFPDKVALNLAYFYNNSLLGDIKIIIKTLINR
ncbi:MAG: sugar transferase [Flavobacterium sp.]|nr:sugar transferase [Flavobacterium sp.]